MVRHLFFVVMLGLLVGCDSPSVGGTGGTAGGGGAPGGGGQGGSAGQGGQGGSGGCGAQQVADAFGNCLDTCVRSTDCAADHACHMATGLCLPVPQDACDPVSCQVGWVCPASGTGPCEPGPGYCEADTGCSFGERCDAGRCVSRVGDVVKTCAGPGECPLGMTCQLGVCVGCLDDIQCVLADPDAKCVLGTCVTGQVGTAAQCLTQQCPAGTRCNPTNGQCEPTCDTDADCAANEICAPVAKRCVTDPGCATDADCTGTMTCTTGLGMATGICTGCGDTVPCDPGLVCILGACLPDIGAGPCDQAQCTVDQACDPLDSSCYPADGSCTTDADCRGGHTCNFLGLCSGCSVDGDCRPSQRCILSTCVVL